MTAVRKRFQRHRLGHRRQSLSSFGNKRLFFIVLLIIGFVLLLPFFRILNGPFGGLVWYAPSLLNGKYVILLQNEAELRPSGGFVSAFAVVEFTGLKPQIKVYDSYAVADPATPVPAPKALSDVFSSDPKFTGWEFRDANFSPDFAEAARQSLSFLQSDTRFQDDVFAGVVAINLAAVEDLLAQLGIEQNEDMSLFLELQRETKNIDLHSLEELATRKNVLSELSAAIIDEAGYFSLPTITKSLALSAATKNVQFWFADADVQRYFAERGWHGRLDESNLFAVNVANLGAKKSDRYILRRYFSDLTIAADGTVTENFRLQMQHAGSENLISGNGSYFIRIIRPPGTEFTGDLTGWEQRSLAYGEEFSILRQISAGETLRLDASFTLPYSWTMGSHEIFWNKQSGTQDRLFLSAQGAGEMFLDAHGCDRTIAHENVLFCESLIDTDASILLTLTPDTLPPILENATFQNSSEIFIRFSEPVEPQNAPENITLQCGDSRLPVAEIVNNPADLRDRTIVLSSVVELDGTFCRFEWRAVSDLKGNATDIILTLPLRPPA